MKKSYFLITLGFLLCSYETSSAHTISEQLEALYGETYLPLFVIAKLLPYIGLGTLAYEPGGKFLQSKWLFICGIAIGFLLGFYLETNHNILFLNKIGIVFIGILILFSGKINRKFISVLIAFFGLSLGYENGISIAHTHDFLWVYIAILTMGIVLYSVLTTIQFIGNPKRNVIRFAIGFFMILSGLFVVLLL